MTTPSDDDERFTRSWARTHVERQVAPPLKVTADLLAIIERLVKERDEARAMIDAIGAAMPGNVYAHGHTPLDAVEALVGWSGELQKERDAAHAEGYAACQRDVVAWLDSKDAGTGRAWLAVVASRGGHKGWADK